MQDVKSIDKDEQRCVFSSSGDTSLLLKVNSCNGAYFRQTRPICIQCGVEHVLRELSLSLAFSFPLILLYTFFFSSLFSLGVLEVFEGYMQSDTDEQ